MASTFRPVNSPTAIKIDSRGGSAPSPTTPTPTKATFSQRPLPTHPFPQAVKIPENIDEVKVLEHDNLQHSGRISHGESEDVDMDESDREAHGNDDGAESDEEDSVNADSSKSGKQKKNQRFWCTEYPPCHLSFTRSEHLARHIRKHTGERPFQCHCSRRFSRLDNLRQHAQTVHVNEEIPLDSLAAAGTRFQRQLRTDRVRQPGRARAATAGSIGGPTRGHAKSLSTSSIGSVGSTFSTGEDARRRPPPLVMAETGIRYLPDAYIPQRPPSPSDFSTPTSATFSTGHNSPHWGQVMTSTPSAHSRSHSAYGSSVPARRLSVPTDGMPFQFQHGGNGRPMLGLGSPMGGSHPAPFSPASSVIPSPTSSIYSRRESLSGTEDWRRRTWHPDSNFNAKPPASRLGQLSHAYPPLQYPSPPQNHVHFPAQQQQQSNASVRLPGIESFGPVPHRPASPLKNVSSPMLIEPDVVHPRALHPTAHATESEDKRSAANWDMNLHRGLIRLDITSNATPSDNASIWAREANQAMDAQIDRVRRGPPTVRFNEPVIADNPPKSASPHGFHKYTMSAPSIASSRESKRRGWHQSGIQVEGPPEKTARIDRMVHPNVREFSGFPARESHPSGPAPRDQNPGDRAMGRLEALVAVATGEGNATKAY